VLNETVDTHWSEAPALAPAAVTRPRRPARHPVLDGYVDAFSVPGFLDTLTYSAECRERLLVGNHNMHSLALHRTDPEFARFYEQLDFVFIDGAPVVGLARMRGPGVGMEHRLAVLDWIWPLFAHAEANGMSIVHVGGSRAMLDDVRTTVLSRHPGLRLTLIDGYFDAADPGQNAAVLAAVAAADPDVVLVGMGMPRQERWLLHNLDALPHCPVVTVGGVLSFIGADRPTPPRWLGRIGLEWVYRLATEPTRLWHRYLVEPLPLLPVVAREAAGALARSSRRTS
jgi:N-acetylglucosaminyldiphosphoundecaprenol N-acetyl-beta-D-mannosaminyltransferase